MKFLTGENGRNPKKIYPESVLFITKHTWNDRDAFLLGSQTQVNLDIPTEIMKGIQVR